MKNGYVCFQLPIDKANKKKAELTRALVAGTLKKYGYKGWSNKIDRGNDANAFYFVVENKEGEIVAATRMIRRIPGSRLPLEQGVKADGSSYSVEGLNERIADINSFYHKKGHGRALILLYAAMARYCVYTGVSKAFCMLDIENQKIKKLYFQAGFKYSERFDEKIYFPTFGRVGKKGLEPTGWTILEMNQTNILKFALLSLKYRFV